MLKTLRNRLILSHILPLAIVIPLLGIAMLYLLETLVYLPSLSNQLVSDAHFLAQITGRQPDLWYDSQRAVGLLSSGSLSENTRLMLLSPQGVLLATNDPQTLNQLNTSVDLSGNEAILAGQEVKYIQRSRGLSADVIDVFVPVYSPAKQFVGIVRLTYRYASLADEFFQLRFLIAGVVLIGVLAGSGLGYLLAVNIEAPIKEVTQAVDELADGSRTQLLKESGPEETRHLALSVNHLVTRLRQMEEARKQLLVNLMHELGRPLGALRSAIQALSNGAEKDPQFYRELVTGMDQEAERLQRLLEDLAHLHEQLLGTLELDRQELCLEEWLPGMLRTWQEAARERQIRWEVEIAQNLPVIQADPMRLAQIVGNLVSNAIKFTPTGGSVSISARAREDAVGITVKDSGPGILPEDQKEIFKPFYRGPTGRRFPQGMGLGLSIVQDLVDAHGGTLEVESVPGTGSRFTVWLPAIADSQK